MCWRKGKKGKQTRRKTTEKKKSIEGEKDESHIEWMSLAGKDGSAVEEISENRNYSKGRKIIIKIIESLTPSIWDSFMSYDS